MTDRSVAPRVRIIHETNPAKYFPALYELERQGRIRLVGSHRYSVVREWVRAGVKDRTGIRERTRNAAADAWLRLTLWRVRGEVVVLGWAPWDWRLLIYRGLARRNTVLYHTSWPRWGLDEVPRRMGPLTPVLHRVWQRFLEEDHVRVVAVTPACAASLRDHSGVDATVVPHAVPEPFFGARESAPHEKGRQGALGVLYVGELSEKKGVAWLLGASRLLSDAGIRISVVGDGPLREDVVAASTEGRLTYHGRLSDRWALAQTMADHDVLVLFSQRQPDWEELFGIVLIEALAAGLGIIASRHAGPVAILGEDAVGLFDEEDGDAALQLLLELHERPEERNQFRELHRHRADEHRIDAVAERWAALVGVATSTRARR